MSLSDFIKAKYPANLYLNLFELMGLTKTKTTRLLNDPSLMSKGELYRLSEILEVEPSRLIGDFGCGKNRINLAEAEELLAIKEVS
jgi:NifB/MoaA-like Fe-S oxidoreductase